MSNLKYLMWLCDMVGLDTKKYKRLASTLYRMPFTWPGDIPMDRNRAQDGAMLRYYYNQETGNVPPSDDVDCSVLEMLVALAERMDSLIGEPGITQYDVWFKEIISNLELDGETDEFFREDEVREVIHNVMDREIDFDGSGGLFPLRHPYEDQRELSIWDQMSCYINERY